MSKGIDLGGMIYLAIEILNKNGCLLLEDFSISNLSVLFLFRNKVELGCSYVDGIKPEIIVKSSLLSS